MLTIDIDAVALKAIDRKLEEMQEKIEQLKHTGLADELADWETQDMHAQAVRLRVYQNNKRVYDPILKRRDLARCSPT